jgi:hypothetical protein
LHGSAIAPSFEFEKAVPTKGILAVLLKNLVTLTTALLSAGSKMRGKIFRIRCTRCY